MDSILSKPLVFVSACLLGERVRYDGGHKRLPGLLERLSEAGFRPLPVCPEVGAGLPVPRPPVELVVEGGAIRARGVWDRRLEVGQRIEAFARAFLERHRPFGFIGKGNSPSCGREVPLHRPEGGRLGESAEGLFVREFLARWPDLPVIEAEEIEHRWPSFVEAVWEAFRRAGGGGSSPPGR